MVHRVHKVYMVHKVHKAYKVCPVKTVRLVLMAIVDKMAEMAKMDLGAIVDPKGRKGFQETREMWVNEENEVHREIVAIGVPKEIGEKWVLEEIKGIAENEGPQRGGIMLQLFLGGAKLLCLITMLEDNQMDDQFAN
jgi:hypothetical protein